ncbi:MAG: (Fe-S)-binding protein [Planctomycetales bacterium]|nr:(Fe-S)-binding protein [Planctomycetales bacterium]
MTHSTQSPSTSADTPTQSACSEGAAPLDERYFLDCVHCGLCTSACPTYVELGNENDSPRGRIYLMRAVTEGRLDLTPSVRRHLDLCLDCRACESACPSGVQYGRLIEPFRVNMTESQSGTGPASSSDDWFRRWILFGLFPHRDRLAKALVPARIAQTLRLDRLVQASGLLRLLPPRLQQLVAMLPPLGPQLKPLPSELPAIGQRRARVAMFRGCVGDVMFGATQWATARVLQENGCDVVIPQEQVCCGAIHYHAGAQQPARELAETNLRAFDLKSIDAIVVNVAGCGSMLKDYGHHWQGGDQAGLTAFADKVRDVHEFLDELGLIPPQREYAERVTYHDACHLAHAQKIREAPRRLLQQIPGLELVELVESELCCGAAGTYNLTEPEMAQRLARRKLQRILETGANTVVTANAGCLLQIAREARQQGQRFRLVHPMDLLADSYAKR